MEWLWCPHITNCVWFMLLSMSIRISSVFSTASFYIKQFMKIQKINFIRLYTHINSVLGFRRSTFLNKAFSCFAEWGGWDDGGKWFVVCFFCVRNAYCLIFCVALRKQNILKYTQHTHIYYRHTHRGSKERESETTDLLYCGKAVIWICFVLQFFFLHNIR